MLLLFLTFSVLVANPKILLYTVLLGTVEARSANAKKTTTTTTTVANPARGLLTREKRTKEKLWRVISQVNLFRQNITTNSKAPRRVGKEKELTGCVQSDIRAFGIAGGVLESDGVKGRGVG